MRDLPSQSTDRWTFSYGGCAFECSVEAVTPQAFLPHVVYRSGVLGSEEHALPVDTDPYASAAEAMRHAEQQAVRWTHDRRGMGRAGF